MMIALRKPSSKVIDLAGELVRNSGCRDLLRTGNGAEAPAVMPDVTIHAAAEILESLNPILYRASLPNGKIILAHLSKPLTVARATFKNGARVIVELTPYDFDNARILGTAGSDSFPDAEAAENDA